MITISLSLALCTVIFRRFLDSCSGRIPTVIPTSNCNVTSTMVILSGALYYLYSHLKKGTLVRVGTKNQLNSHKVSASQNCIQRRRTKSTGWFFRNAKTCRSKCTDAIYKVAKQSLESIMGNEKLNRSIYEINSKQSRCTDETQGPPCDVLYNNDAFVAESIAYDLNSDKANKSIQNVMSLEKVKKGKKSARRISFKLDDAHKTSAKSVGRQPKGKKKLVRDELPRNFLAYKRKPKYKGPLVFDLRRLITKILKWKSKPPRKRVFKYADVF